MKSPKITSTPIYLNPYFLTTLSGLLAGLVCWFPTYALLFWFGLVPFFYVLKTVPPTRLWKHGILFGLILGFISQFWIWEASNEIFQTVGFITLAAHLLFSLCYALLPILFTIGISFWLKRRKTNQQYLDLFLFPILWVSLEWIHLQLFSIFPWTNLFLGFTQYEYLYLIQLVSITGVWGISFLLVLSNLLLTQAIQTRHSKYLIYAFSLFAVITIGGYWTVTQYESDDGNPSFKVSLLQENIPTTVQWNATTGDSLAQVFLSLNQKAATQNPDLILWSESAVPWSFRTDDHLINESLKITQSTQAEHIMGMLYPTDSTESQFYNSALQLQPDGRLTGIYKKNHLVTFGEKPLFNQMESSPHHLKAGEAADLLHTRVGKAGVALCNEWSIAEAIRKRTLKGADFFLALDQHGRFGLDYMSSIHFGLTRFRAIENRRDIAINSNYGYAGKIAASGAETKYTRSKSPKCYSVSIKKYGHQTIYSQWGDWLPLLCLPISLAFLFLIKIKSRVPVQFFPKEKKLSTLFPRVSLTKKIGFQWQRPFFILVLLCIIHQDLIAISNPPFIFQHKYRWRNDNGVHNAATYAANLNTPISIPANERIRLRVEIANGNTTSGSITTIDSLDLHVFSSTSSEIVTTASTTFRLYDSPNVTNHLTTTNDELPSGFTHNPGGKYIESIPYDATLVGGSSFELEFMIEPNCVKIDSTYNFLIIHPTYSDLNSLLNNVIAPITITSPCPPNNVIYVDAQASGCRYGTSWTDAFTNLQDAIDLLNKNICNNITEIWVAEGDYSPSKDKDGNIPSDPRDATFFFDKDIRIYGGFTGTETTLSQRGNSLSFFTPTILTGDIGVPNDDSDNVYTVVHTEEVSNNFLLDGFHIQNGNANGSGMIRTVGGGWYNDVTTIRSDPTVRRVVFKDNKAKNFGGGMFNNGSSGQANPIMDKCIFWRNSAINGGGLFSGNGVGPGNSGVANFVVTNSIFVENSATSRGGAYGHTDSDFNTPIFINTTFYNNTATHGGALGIFAWDNGQSPLPLRNCIFWNNSSTFGLTSSGAGSFNISNCIIQENSCPASVTCGFDVLFATDPLFVDETINDFTLQECSTAIDRGTNIYGLNDDLEGLPRPSNSIVDLGAHEFQGPPNGTPLNCYEDFDNDGYGNANVMLEFCNTCPQGYVENSSDCNDGNANDVNINVTGNPISAAFYRANNSVSSANSIVIGTPGVDKVIFQAGHEVVLNVGFVAATGSDFQAIIGTDCSPPVTPFIQPEIENELLETTLGEKENLTIEEEVSIKIEKDELKIYPNPFRNETTLEYTISKPSAINIFVYDAQAHQVATLLNNVFTNPGTHQISYHPAPSSSGVYTILFQTENGNMAKRIVIIND